MDCWSFLFAFGVAFLVVGYVRGELEDMKTNGLPRDKEDEEET